MKRFTVTTFDWPHRWFAVRDNQRGYHIGSYGSREDAERVVADFNHRIGWDSATNENGPR